MDRGNLLGAVTLVTMLLFFATTFWTLSRRRDAEYRKAERMPLEDEHR